MSVQLLEINGTNRVTMFIPATMHVFLCARGREQKSRMPFLTSSVSKNMFKMLAQ